MQECKPMKVPILTGAKLFIDQCHKVQEEVEGMPHVPCASVVRSLLYGMVYTRPKNCNAMGVLSRYCKNEGRNIT